VWRDSHIYFLNYFKNKCNRKHYNIFSRESQGEFDLLKNQNVPEEAMQMICHRPGQFMTTQAAFCLGSSASPDFHVFCLKRKKPKIMTV